MNAVKRFLHLLWSHPFEAIISLLVTTTFAAELATTPVSYRAADETVLRSYITAATATGITLEPLYKWVNGTKTKGCIDTPSGFAVLEDGSRREWISYGVKNCNTTTYVTTLQAVRRGLNPTNPSFSSGTGLAWDGGTKFRIIDWPVGWNQGLYTDTVNVTVRSGAVVCGSTSQPCIGVGRYTTAQRNLFTWNTGSTIIHNTSSGGLQFYDGTTWLELAVATGSFVNATTTVAGKVELATIKDQSGALVTGATSAALVVQTRYLTNSGGTAAFYGRIGTLGTNGTYPISMGGTGTGSFTQSGVLIGNHQSKFTHVAPGTNGNILKSNGEDWTSAALTTNDKTVIAYPVTSTATGASNVNVVFPDKHRYVITGSTLTLNVGYEVEYVGTITTTNTGGADDFQVCLDIGVTTQTNGTDTVCSGSLTTEAAYEFSLRCTVLGTAAAGASVAVRGNCTFAFGSNGPTTRMDYGEVNLATNGDLWMKLQGDFGTSDASNNFQIYTSKIRKISSIAF